VKTLARNDLVEASQAQLQLLPTWQARTKSGYSVEDYRCFGLNHAAVSDRLNAGQTAALLVPAIMVGWQPKVFRRETEIVSDQYQLPKKTSFQQSKQSARATCAQKRLPGIPFSLPHRWRSGPSHYALPKNLPILEPSAFFVGKSHESRRARWGPPLVNSGLSARTYLILPVARRKGVRASPPKPWLREFSQPSHPTTHAPATEFSPVLPALSRKAVTRLHLDSGGQLQGWRISKASLLFCRAQTPA